MASHASQPALCWVEEEEGVETRSRTVQQQYHDAGPGDPTRLAALVGRIPISILYVQQMLSMSGRLLRCCGR